MLDLETSSPARLPMRSGWGILGHAEERRSLVQPELGIHEAAAEAVRAVLAEIEQYLASEEG